VIEKIRLFLVVMEEGSLRRAAERLRMSQSSITRQIQTMEHDLGGRLLERTSSGVKPTAGGHALAEKAKALLAGYDAVVAEVRALGRGEGERLRIGYVASAVHQYLGPALAGLRRTHPKVKVTMLDLTPGEQIAALREGKIDLALSHLGLELWSREFYTRRIAVVPTIAVLPMTHRLARKKRISIAELKGDAFLGAPESDVPGYNQKIIGFCRQFGKFKPQLIGRASPSSLAEGITLIANEEGVSLHPAFISHLRIPNVAMLPVTDAGATWDLFLVWQRGKTASPLRALLDAVQP
jgi:molybdate transport repressor ModE-like protein